MHPHGRHDQHHPHHPRPPALRRRGSNLSGKAPVVSMDMYELEAETAELLPGREALGKLSFTFTKSVDVAKNINVANISASNHASADNYGSFGADAESEAVQSITVTQ
jgi:hypothetical protein